jgi:hypothetical protein
VLPNHFPDEGHSCKARWATLTQSQASETPGLTSLPVTFVTADFSVPLTPSIPLTPSAFLEAVAARLDCSHGADAAPTLLRAIPIKTCGTTREYSGFVYASLRDPRTADTIDARIPVAIATNLECNHEAVFVGLIHYEARRGELRPEFRVDAVQEAGPLRLLSKDDLIQRWSAAIARPKSDVCTALQGPTPRLAVITGVAFVAVGNIRAQLLEAEADLTLDVVRLSMHRPAEVARSIQQSTDVQAVALTRAVGKTSTSWTPKS